MDSHEPVMIRVYTKAPEADCYPEGLARSIHFALETESGESRAFNKNYGILFAKGRISGENTIIPAGIRNPGIFRMKDGTIGITGERVYENGETDETCEGKVLFWKTADLIHFEEEKLIDPAELDGAPAETMCLERNLAEAALRYWSPIFHTGTAVPETVRVGTERELDDIRAVLSYSDGSVREKKVNWQKDGIRFDRPGSYTLHGTVSQQRFAFPLAKGYGDPVIFHWDGKWYYISTNDNLNDIGLYLREGESVEALFTEDAEEHLILPFSPERGFEQTFWAPEFHVIGGELYILFAVSGHAWGPQCHLMKRKKTGGMTEEEGWENPVRVIRKDGRPLAEKAITLDMTYIRAESGSYVIWSYRENIGMPLDSGSMLYIASIDEEKPWQLTSDPVLLSRPLFGWENVSGTINNEGPNAFVKDGTVYVTYSGGSANRYTYALGLLTANTGSDLLNPDMWRKSIAPVLTFRSVEGEYGPGHNSFFVNGENELMIAYHAETDIRETLRCDGIRRVHFRKDRTPYFGMSPREDLSSAKVTTKLIVEPGKQ